MTNYLPQRNNIKDKADFINQLKTNHKMTNPGIVKVLREAVAENRQDLYNQKGTLIIDIIRAKKMLWGFGNKKDNAEFLTEQGRIDLVYRLTDMDIEELEALNSRLENQINGLMAAMRAAKQMA